MGYVQKPENHRSNNLNGGSVAEINKVIKEKLNSLSPEVRKLALTALELSEAGHSETSISEQLAVTVRQIIKSMKGDTSGEPS